MKVFLFNMKMYFNPSYSLVFKLNFNKIKKNKNLITGYNLF